MWQKFLLVFAFSIAVIGGNCHAAIVTFRFQGEVLEFNPVLASEFSVGETITGTYAFDSDAVADVSGDFTLSVVSFEGSVGDYNFRLTSGLGDITLNGGYTVVGFTQGANVGTSTSLLHALQFSGGSLPSGVLPLTPPDLSQFSSRLFTLDFFNTNVFPPPRLVGRIDSLTIVPEPTSFLITMLGLSALATRRGNRAQTQSA